MHRDTARPPRAAWPATGTSAAAGPWVLREYALLADGERGALIGPDGDVAWMCAPRWDSEAVFSRLIGGAGGFLVTPEDRWWVWGGYYDEGSLIRNSRWVLTDSVTECREALAMPADRDRAVLLRRVRAVRGDARVSVHLDLRAGYGEHAMAALRREGAAWTARSGRLHVRLTGAEQAVPVPGGGLGMRLALPAGAEYDLVLEVGERLPDALPDPRLLWESTRRTWREALPDCSDLIAPRDACHAYAVLHGLTSSHGGMVAAATTSLPERIEAGRNYDYRFAWVRDQCYAGIAVAAHGAHPLLDRAVRFVTERVLTDGPGLHPAYTVDGGPVPSERALALSGYPGGSDRIGNHAARQFQLDTFGEVLQLLAAAARLGRLDHDARKAVDIAVHAVADNWQRPDAGLWELHDARWTHSRLAVVAGLRSLATALPGRSAEDWSHLADTIVRETERRCLHPSGYWQRSEDDTRVDAALLIPLARGALPPDSAGSLRTRRAIERHLSEDGYVYRFSHGDGPLGEAEGAFLLCGFMMALATHAQGDPVAAARWFERNRAACGSPGLFAEEFDVNQRQLRGNLPQAFVHALLLECAARLAPAGEPAGEGHG